MINRKILYGYKIQNGEIVVYPTEAMIVNRTYTLYANGLSYQKISNILNEEKIPFSQEAPVWNKHKVKRILDNPRYTGTDGYPAIVDGDTFQTIQKLIREKTTYCKAAAETRPTLLLKEKLRCKACGNSLRRQAGANRRKDTLYLKCNQCGLTFTITDEALLSEVTRQTEENEASSDPTPYVPSEAVIHLTNAIDRGLESLEQPENVVSLILQGISARYDCFPSRTAPCVPCCLEEKADFAQTVSYITIAADNAVTVYFKS